MNDRNGNRSGTPAVAATTTASGPPLSLTDRVRSLRLPDNSAAGTRARTPWLPWLLCALFAGLSGYLGYQSYSVDAQTPVSKDEPASAADAVGRPGVAGPVGRVALEAGGYVIPVHRVQVAPKVGGEVVELFIEEGQFVKKGQVLARLDRSKYEYEYRRTVAQAEQAKAEYDKLQHGNRPEERRQAEAALREAEALVEQIKDESARARRSQTAASMEEMVRVGSRLRQAEHKVVQLAQLNKMMQDGWRREEIDKAKAAHLLACAQRDNAKYDLDNCDVCAPVSGRILKKQAEVGNTVRPEAYSNGLSASLCEMADVRDLEVDVDVSERDLESVFPGQQCEVRTEAFPNHVYPGRISRLMPEANRSKASVSVRVHIDIPDDDRLLRPEMRARVSFLSKNGETKSANK
jgi:HlyD family secretion protein